MLQHQGMPNLPIASLEAIILIFSFCRQIRALSGKGRFEAWGSMWIFFPLWFSYSFHDQLNSGLIISSITSKWRFRAALQLRDSQTTHLYPLGLILFLNPAFKSPAGTDTTGILLSLTLPHSFHDCHYTRSARMHFGCQRTHSCMGQGHVLHQCEAVTNS